MVAKELGDVVEVDEYLAQIEEPQILRNGGQFSTSSPHISANKSLEDVDKMEESKLMDSFDSILEGSTTPITWKEPFEHYSMIGVFEENVTLFDMKGTKSNEEEELKEWKKGVNVDDLNLKSLLMTRPLHNEEERMLKE